MKNNKKMETNGCFIGCVMQELKISGHRSNFIRSIPMSVCLQIYGKPLSFCNSNFCH